MSRLAWIAACLFVLAVPLVLVAASVTWAVNSPRVYNRGFEKYGVSLTTGIAAADLRQAGADLRRYFNSGDEPLVLRARALGVEREIFNPREVQHMGDVKRLVRGVYAVLAGSGAYLLATAAAGFLWRRRRFVPTLAGLCLGGGGLTVGLVLGVGLMAVAGFDSLFLTFHRLSFSNDFWLLDPRTDYLVMMFPQGFWFDATLLVATLTGAGALTLVALSGGYLLYRRRRREAHAEPPPGD
ncbi:MAG: TIGR01906 family membrane protein, partial [Chloroflexota bacterium]